MAETVQSYPGLYSLGSGINQAFLDGTGINSIFLNTRDVYSPGNPDYILFGPGSQVWIVGYSVRASTPSPFPAPTNPLGLRIDVQGSYDIAIPFFSQTEQQIILPVYAQIYHYAGRARVESPVALLSLNNNTGNTLEISFQFWGKAL